MCVGESNVEIEKKEEEEEEGSFIHVRSGGRWRCRSYYEFESARDHIDVGRTFLIWDFFFSFLSL